MTDTALVKEKRTGRPPGYICTVCQEAIPVDSMVNIVLSGLWSIQVPDLPQLGRTLHLHREPCAEVYIQQWEKEKVHD